MNSERDETDTGPSQVNNDALDDAPDLEGDGDAGAPLQFEELGDEDAPSENTGAGTTDATAPQLRPSAIAAAHEHDSDSFGDFEDVQRAPSEAETPDDTLSLQNSPGRASPREYSPSPVGARSPLASPAPSVAARPGLSSPRRSSLLPFDRRFQAKRSISGTSSLLLGQRGPGQLTPHSRTSSLSTSAIQQERDTQHEAPDAPWEVVRWARLGKLKAEVFSEAGKRKFGKVTCMAVTSSIALGTSRGLLLVFDAKQQLKAVVGEGTKAVEAGAVTAISISADHSTVAAGHANGDIFTWEISRPAKPFLQIPPSSLAELRGTTKDGHVAGVSVLHLGFLGVRHTALVSADDRGMAFSHLATRGMGALGRTVKSTRILGRYPDADAAIPKPRKPSSVLAFAPLPMGTAECGTDNMGLVAMLTPYLLVIVSTTPVAQTQHKVFRAKDVAPHSAMSGCLAWYPAMQNESKSRSPKDTKTSPKLAYCWSNVLTILEVTEIHSDEDDREGPPELFFAEQHTLRNEEPIVAMQWLSRNLLAVLTVSQQLVIIEHPPLRPTDSSDLLRKHIYHVDLFSSQLGNMVEKLDDENATMHGVVADAFYMSFRSYKGRLFLLGFEDIAIGTLSNWADRLVAIMEHGDYIGAIRLAAKYFAGQADLASIGLPLSPTEREEVVGDRLLGLMLASLKYAFGRNPDAVDRRASVPQLEDLVTCCFDACDSLQNQDFLFEEIYNSYTQEGHQDLFLNKLQERILIGQIQVVPPVALKALVNSFAERDLHDQLEELLCRLIPTTMDLDQITKLCKSHELFDALFYVWSQGIHDYTTILGDLLDAIEREQISDEADASSKIYTYLSYSLTGRVYPTSEQMPDDQAVKAKAEVYSFLFSGSRPSADGKRTKLHTLRQLLRLDTAAFMSMLNEAFEDPFLNGAEERPPEDDLGPISDEQRFGLTLNRQYILTILFDFMAPPDFENEEILFLDMFIARSSPKYPQYILLRDNIMYKVLTELCTFATAETADDCQLSAEYLLSTYRPPDLAALMPLFFEARFFRVIKTIYRTEGEYDKFLQTCIDDKESPDGIYECIADCMRPGASLSPAQKKQFHKVLETNLQYVVKTDVQKAAATLDANIPSLHVRALNSLDDDNHAKYVYLREVLEPSITPDGSRGMTAKKDPAFTEQYIQLLCDFDPQHIRAFIEGLHYGDLKLDSVLPALESSGMIDSAVVLMAREGQIRRGIDRLVQHLEKLGGAFQSLMAKADSAPDTATISETADDLVLSIEKYSNVGIWLCQRHGKVNVEGVSGQANVDGAVKGEEAQRHPSNDNVARLRQAQRRTNSRYSLSDELNPAEAMWLDLVDSIVRVTRSASDSLASIKPSQDNLTVDATALADRFRSTVQSTFTALLRATTSSPPAPRFLPILRGFLNRASKSSPSLTHLRQVLGAVFEAYAFEGDILGLANKLLDKDLFVGVEEVAGLRRRGWRPLGLACGGCGKKVWGPGAGKEIWEEWCKDQQQRQRLVGTGEELAARSRSRRREQVEGKGKGRAQDSEPATVTATGEESDASQVETPDSVVVFACRHLFHEKCLRDLLAGQMTGDGREKRYTCPLENSVGEDEVAQV